MKYLKKMPIGLAFLLGIALIYQLLFSSLVKPWETNKALHSGCKTFEQLAAKSAMTAEEGTNLAQAFTRASWLDSKYLVLAQASLMTYWSTTSSNMGDLQTNENYKARAMLSSFCMKEQ